MRVMKKSGAWRTCSSMNVRRLTRVSSQETRSRGKMRERNQRRTLMPKIWVEVC
jgi:hypothetical protein